MRLYLLPHQDDEFSLLQWICEDMAAGEDFRLVFLSDGTFGGMDSERRNNESLRVLTALGVPTDKSFFFGSAQNIHDGSMHTKLERIWAGLTSWIDEENIHPTSIIMPAWEGGHQDHDAAHVIGMSLARRFNCEAQSRQVAYYHGYRMPWITFRVQAPLAANGVVDRRPIPWRQRLTYLHLFSYYTSQWRTWLALYPFVAINMLLRGAELTQPVSRERLLQPPHAGSPLYEKRGFAKQSEVLDYCRRFMDSVNETLS